MGLLSRRHPGKDGPVQEQLRERAVASQRARGRRRGAGQALSPPGWGLHTHLREELPKVLAEDLVGAATEAEVEATVPGGRRVHNHHLQRRKREVWGEHQTNGTVQ